MDVRSAVAATVVLAALTACNGDESNGTTTVAPASSSTTSSTSIGSADSTTTSPTTAPSTSSPSSPSTVSTTEPTSTSIGTVPLTVPSTTSVPLDDLTAEEREVVEAVLEAFQLFNELRLDPTNDDLYEAALDARVDPARDAAQKIIDGYRSDGLRSRPFPGLPASITPFLDTLEIGDDGANASLDVCWLNSNVLVEVGAGEDGGDRVVNDVISSQYMRYEVERSDDRWLVRSILGGDVFEGATTCE